jgi:hypothetical protein
MLMAQVPPPWMKFGLMFTAHSLLPAAHCLHHKMKRQGESLPLAFSLFGYSEG